MCGPSQAARSPSLHHCSTTSTTAQSHSYICLLYVYTGASPGSTRSMYMQRMCVPQFSVVHLNTYLCQQHTHQPLIYCRGQPHAKLSRQELPAFCSRPRAEDQVSTLHCPAKTRRQFKNSFVEIGEQVEPGFSHDTAVAFPGVVHFLWAGTTVSWSSAVAPRRYQFH